MTCTRSSPCGMPMMTSHLCAASVLRTNPVACGYQLYDSPFPSLSANNSASLFSNPSPLSVENGMLFGSALTRSTLRINKLDGQIWPIHGLREHLSRQKHRRNRRARNAQAQAESLLVGGIRHRPLLVEPLGAGGIKRPRL